MASNNIWMICVMPFCENSPQGRCDVFMIIKVLQGFIVSFMMFYIYCILYIYTKADFIIRKLSLI